MSMSLSHDAIQQFRNYGFTPAIPVMTSKEAGEYRIQLQAIEAVIGTLKGGYRLKCHMLYKWVSELIHSPIIVDRVEDLLGPNILCWGTDLWIKEPNSSQFVSWHQDNRYWGVEGKLLTAWIALSTATVESGCMRMLPGSHLKAGMEHQDTFHEDNMLTRGQTISDQIDENQAVDIEVGTGEAVFFDYGIAHASHPNRSNDRRIGLAIRYVVPSARQVKSDWDSATLIRGEDKFGNFIHEPKPTIDFDPVTVEFHKKTNKNYMKILYSGTGLTEHRT